MDKAQLRERLLGTFLEELEERVRALNDGLLALEQDQSSAERTELLQNLFRSAHTLKGSSRIVDVPLFGELCHQLEDVLTAIREGDLAVDPKLISLLFEAVDALQSVAEPLRAHRPIDSTAFESVIVQLRQEAAGPAGSTKPAAAETAPRPAERAVESSGPDEIESSDCAVDDEDSAPGPQGPPSIPVQASVGPGADPVAQQVESNEQPQTGKSSAGDVADRGRSAASTGGSATVRVPHEKLDSLLAQSGELLIARRRVEARPSEAEFLRDSIGSWRAEWRQVEPILRRVVGEANTEQAPYPKRGLELLQQAGERLGRWEKDLERLTRTLTADARQLNQACTAMQDDVHRIRMLPFSDACLGLQRAVRDLTTRTEKQVELVVEGGGIEIDRSILEGLSDPLLHLVRNAVDHGIESSVERERAGKPASARVVVSASLRGAQVDIAVSDDGRGLDFDRIRQKLRERHLPEPSDHGKLLQSIFQPGFSTAALITDVSGRGVGLDVVRDRLESLHGTVDVATEPGFGTRFTITVPLTLTTINALLVECGGQAFALATTNVRQLVRFSASDIKSVQGRDSLPLGGAPIPVVALAQILNVNSQHEQLHPDRLLGVIVTSGNQEAVVVVDAVLAEQDVVIKNLGPRIRRLRHVAGATLLASGRIGLLLNAAHLLRSAPTAAPRNWRSETPAETPRQSAPRLLIVDDSLTTRTLLKSILQVAGYEVIAAVDGEEGWRRLQEEGFQLVVSDVEMPRLDGFALTERIRQTSRLSSLPVVLVTGRESDDDQTRGIEVGADAYLVKSAFDQTNLLQTIRQLL